MEELAKLQEDLNNTQADKAIEAQKEALDKMEEDYHAEKDGEIKILDDSISSTQKLYDMAIDYIRNNWNTLYSELIAWNTEYGSDLNSQITAAFDAAQEAAQRYGDFVTAIMGGISDEIDGITQQIEDLNQQMSNLSTSASSHSGSYGSGSGDDKNTAIGNKYTHTTSSKEDDIHATIKEMYANMNEHGGSGSSTSPERKAYLSERNLELGARLKSLGISAYRSTDAEDLGTWYTDETKRVKLFDAYRDYTYHTGGFVGKSPLKPNERFIKAEDGELILTANQQDSFAAQISAQFDRISTMTEALSRSIMEMPISARNSWPDGMIAGGGSSVSNVTNNNSQPVEIHMGDITINAPSGNGKIIADEVRKITRENMNEISRMLRRP